MAPLLWLWSRRAEVEGEGLMDPFYVLGVLVLIVAAFGFGHIAGQNHQKRIWRQHLAMVKAMRERDE